MLGREEVTESVVLLELDALTLLLLALTWPEAI